MPSEFVWHFGKDHGLTSLVVLSLKKESGNNFNERLAHLGNFLNTLFNPKAKKEQHDLFGCAYEEYKLVAGDEETVGLCYTISGTDHIQIWHHYHCCDGTGELICELRLSPKRDAQKVLGVIQTYLVPPTPNIPSLTQALYAAAA